MKNLYIKFILLLLIQPYLFINAVAFGYNPDISKISGTLTGKVYDNNTGKTLPGANIILGNTILGCATNYNGEFEIKNIPVGQYKVIASMLGYSTRKYIVTVEEGKTAYIEFALNQGIIEMGSIVVTGTGTAHLYENTPVKTEVIPKRIIQLEQAVNLAQVLNLQTGVRVENNCSNCNFTQVRILGFDGKYSQILIDGDAVINSVAGVYGLEHFPDEMIEQVEIVKGGGSALYGGGAVAGTINLRTRRPAFNGYSLKFNGNSLGGTFDHKIGAVAEIVNDNNTSGVFVFGSVRSRNPYDRNDDVFSELGSLKNETIGFNWYYRPIENGEIITSFHRIHEERRGGNKFEKPPHEADLAEAIEHFRYGGKVKWEHRLSAIFDYKIFYAFSNIDRNSYFGGLSGDTPEDQLDALKFYGKTKNDLHISGLSANYMNGIHTLTGGVEYSSDYLNDKSAAHSAYYIDENYKNFGIYLQDDLQFGMGNDFAIILGVRADKHSEIKSWIFSPRINLKYEIDEGVIFRAAYTTGFKAPETYNEDLHLCGLEGNQRITRNSTNLKEEKSYSFSGGIEYQGFINQIPVLAGITGFYTKLNNAFTEVFVKSEGDFEIWERINASGAGVKGIEMDFGIKPISKLEFRGGLTYKIGRYDEELDDFNTKKFLRSPDIFGYARTILSLNDNLDLYTAVKYTGNAQIPHEVVIESQNNPMLILEEIGSFVEIDLGVNYSIPFIKGFRGEISFGVKNITDAYQKNLDIGRDRDPGFVFGPINPRTVYFSIQTSY